MIRGCSKNGTAISIYLLENWMGRKTIKEISDTLCQTNPCASQLLSGWKVMQIQLGFDRFLNFHLLGHTSEQYVNIEFWNAHVKMEISLQNCQLKITCWCNISIHFMAPDTGVRKPTVFLKVTNKKRPQVLGFYGFFPELSIIVPNQKQGEV